MTSRERAEKVARETFLIPVGDERTAIIQRAIDEACEAARAEEREACAKVADDHVASYEAERDTFERDRNWDDFWQRVHFRLAAELLADAIRARGAK